MAALASDWPIHFQLLQNYCWNQTIVLEKRKKFLSQSEAWAAMMDIKSLCKVITLLEDYYREQ
jgi:hypothetical protein